MARLERYPEALDLSRRIAGKFDYEPARMLHSRLEKLLAEAAPIDLDEIDRILEGGLHFKDQRSPTPEARRPTGTRNPLIGWLLNLFSR